MIRVFTEFDWIALVVSLSVFFGYHLWLLARVRRRPESTWFGRAAAARRAWVHEVMSERRDLLAVQTLRNWTMGASFLASTAMLVSMGLLGVVLTSDHLPSVIHNLNLAGSTAQTLVTIKILALVGCMILAFVNFTVTIRYYNHLALAINVPAELTGSIGEQGVCRLLERGALHYTLGMRAYFLASLIVLWLFGPIWMLVGGAAVCTGIYRLDREV